MNKLFAGAATLATLAFAAPSLAATYFFDLTGDYTASWQLDSSPTPDIVAAGQGFILWDVPGFPDAVLGIADLTFYASGIGGGLGIEDFFGSQVLLVADGDQLYTGTEAAPTFKLGTFALTEFQGSGVYSLTISDGVTPGVPEPASWALMIAGFGLVGAGLRRRTPVTV